MLSRSVGFIGLGNMGAPMASNLLGNLKKLVVYDVSRQATHALVEKGAHGADNLETVSKCDVIISMVSATKHVISIMRGDGGLFQKARPGTLFINCSTIDPIASRDLSLSAKELGLRMIDAPVSGGIAGATAGTLTFMVGGDRDDVADAKEILQFMGKRIIHCGGPGNGGIAKLCNNLSLAISMIGTCEAMSLGERLGMDPAVLADVMNSSTARCWSSDSYNPVPGVTLGAPAARGYIGGFASSLMDKDLTLAMAAATDAKARTPLGAAAKQLYGLLCDHGYAEKDFSVMYEFLNRTPASTSDQDVGTCDSRKI